MNLYQNATFLLSVANLHQLPPDHGIEVAFVGRSNTGKSSVLNLLTQNKGLARVSKTPGRTQHINLFQLDENRRIADLPGYGFAKVPPSVKKHWENLLSTYLNNRRCLKGIVIVMDIRHPLKETDQQMLAWSEEADLPVHILLNKSDKLSNSAIKLTELQVKEVINIYQNTISLQIFSVLKKSGIQELKKILNDWFTG